MCRSQICGLQSPSTAIWPPRCDRFRCRLIARPPSNSKGMGLGRAEPRVTTEALVPRTVLIPSLPSIMHYESARAGTCWDSCARTGTFARPGISSGRPLPGRRAGPGPPSGETKVIIGSEPRRGLRRPIRASGSPAARAVSRQRRPRYERAPSRAQRLRVAVGACRGTASTSADLHGPSGQPVPAPPSAISRAELPGAGRFRLGAGAGRAARALTGWQ